MSVLVIVEDNPAIAIPVFEEHVVVACVGLEDRVGDKYQPLRERGDVIFTNGMEPLYFLANRGLHFDLVIDGRYNDVYIDDYKGIDSIPD